MDKTILTLGSSCRNEEEFLEILRQIRIKVLVDVRRFPTSLKFPQFKKENLLSKLQKEGINYLWLGETLGGYRKNGYDSWMRGKEFKKGLKELEKIATKNKTLILCAERLPWRCHRAKIAQKLEEKDWKIIHLIDKNNIWNPKGEKVSPKCEKR